MDPGARSSGFERFLSVYACVTHDVLCGSVMDDMCLGVRTELMSGLRGPEFEV